MSNSFRDWLERGEYLPRFMRDFHDQKDLFKRINEIVVNARHNGGTENYDLPSWIDAHVYVIDFFLWYMAKCGYTLQKSRKRFDEFADVETDLDEFRDRWRKECWEAMKNDGQAN